MGELGLDILYLPKKPQYYYIERGNKSSFNIKNNIEKTNSLKYLQYFILGLRFIYSGYK